MLLKSLILFTLTFTGLISFAASNEEACIANAKNIVNKIECLEKVSVVSATMSAEGLVIETKFEQPMDHANPGINTFGQRVVIIHRDENEPMLLQTSGYSIFGVRLAHIARIFQTNQIQVEHRYFEESIPKNPDWSFLNIKESADDFHNITVAFKKIYPKPWINTGASKGGMTSVYHRYFYPNDLVGTVADVAPLSFSTSDQRYNTFLENVGSTKYEKCRSDLKELQITMLKNAKKFVPNISGNYDFVGSAALAFEHSIIEAPFYFWQYGKPSECGNLPSKNNLYDVYNFFQEIADVSGYTNEEIIPFMAYFYQSATQLGGPGNITAHLEELRQFEFSVNQYTPKDVALNYSNSDMRKVRDWALNNADEVMYIYGEFDPWTAGEFPVSTSGKNTYKFYVPAGNHGANFTQLIGKDKSNAMSIISKWLGKTARKSSKGLSDEVFSKSLDQIEFSVRKKNRL